MINYPIDSMLFQEVSLPDVEIEQIEHGDFNSDIKTGGRKKYGNLKLKKLLTTDHASSLHTYFWDWMNAVQNSTLGGGLVPNSPLYKRTLKIDELDEANGNQGSILNTWYCFGCWPTKLDGLELDRTKGDNTIEQIEISIDDLVKG